MNYYDTMPYYGINSYNPMFYQGMNGGNPLYNAYERQLASYQQQFQQGGMPNYNMGSMNMNNMNMNNMNGMNGMNMMNNNMNMNGNMQQNMPPQQDLYLQSMFMEFLRSPEMRDFTNTFYTKFSQFYKNKTGLDCPVFANRQQNNNMQQQPMNNVQQQPMNNVQPINNIQQQPMGNVQPVNNMQQSVSQQQIQQPINQTANTQPQYIVEPRK